MKISFSILFITIFLLLSLVMASDSPNVPIGETDRTDTGKVPSTLEQQTLPRTNSTGSKTDALLVKPFVQAISVYFLFTGLYHMYQASTFMFSGHFRMIHIPLSIGYAAVIYQALQSSLLTAAKCLGLVALCMGMLGQVNMMLCSNNFSPQEVIGLLIGFIAFVKLAWKLLSAGPQ